MMRLLTKKRKRWNYPYKIPKKLRTRHAGLEEAVRKLKKHMLRVELFKWALILLIAHIVRIFFDIFYISPIVLGCFLWLEVEALL